MLPAVRYLVGMTPATTLTLSCARTGCARDGTGRRGVADAQQEPAFTTSVDVVRHSVAVLDSRGEPVSGLQASDFRINEDDVAQEISVFLAPGSTPLDIALVLDSSTQPAALVARRA